MRRLLQTSTLIALCLTGLLTLAPSDAEAQIRRERIRQKGGWYSVPNSSWRMFPAPRYRYRVGNWWVYPGRNSPRWPYGAPRGYSWPYGYDRSYRWPYSNTPFRDRDWDRRRRNR